MDNEFWSSKEKNPRPQENNAKPKVEIVKEIPAEGQEAMKLMEIEDEKAIMNENLLKETLQSLVYKDKTGGYTLSYAGVRECARKYKNINFGIERVDEDDKYFTAYAFGENIRDNVRIVVPKRQYKMLITARGLVKDEFAFEKACSKAIRNAIKAITPVNYFQTMIKKFLEQKTEVKK